ncbi:MAG: sugar nucleotide-binding protein, partial [bacterium]|nr:sugar nucleotide-binding protein [bacterium]
LRNDPLKSPSGRRVDIRDETAVHAMVAAFRPQVIIHTAGSEQSPERDDVIRAGTANMVRAAAEVRARLVHLSTDVLFNGRRAPYDEDAQPEPLHAYGRAKAAAEAIVQEYDNHVIIRTSLIYSLDEMDRATAGLVGALRSGQPYTLFTDQRRNPVWVETLSRALVELV